MNYAPVVREPAVAGYFYPQEPEVLAAQVKAELADNPLQSAQMPKALIVPHAGYIYSGPVAARAYNLLRPYKAVIKRVVLLGPAHRVPVTGMALPDCERFRTPLGDIPIDLEAVQAISDLPQVIHSALAHAQEHSLEVQLPFLQQVLGDFSLLPLVVGATSAADVAEVLERLWGGEETLIVISSDLSHFHPYQEAQLLDRQTSEMICRLDGHLVGEQACGCYAVNGLLTQLEKQQKSINLLDLRNSGDTAGDKDRVVGYGAYVSY